MSGENKAIPIVAGGLLGLFIFAMTRKAKSGGNGNGGGEEGEGKDEEGEDEEEDEDEESPLPRGAAPVVGRLWRWADSPLPLIRRAKLVVQVQGVYADSPPRALIAIINSKDFIGDEPNRFFRVLSITPMGEFGRTFGDAGQAPLEPQV